MSKILEERVQRLEDTLEIYNLQSRYQYYLTMYKGSRIEELFAKKAKVTVEMNGGEKWMGFEGVRRCFGQLDEVHATQPGRMGSIMALQPLITFAEDGKTANGQWFLIGPSVLPTRIDANDKEHLEAMWMFGRYDIDYIKEDSVWLFKRFGVELHFLSPVAKGWVDVPFPFGVRTFETEKESRPEGKATFPHLYRPEGQNDYGPAPPRALGKKEDIRHLKKVKENVG